MGERDVDPVDTSNLYNRIEHLAHVLRKIGGTISEQLPESGARPMELRSADEPRTMPGEISDAALGRLAAKLYLARRDRERAFPSPELFHDPAWDMLLDIFIAHGQDKYISVMDATLSGQVPSTTALRWVWALEKAGLIERKPDAADKRRKFVVLTERGLKHMRKAIASIGERMAPPLFSA